MHVNAPWNDEGHELGSWRDELGTILCFLVFGYFWVPLVLWALADKFLW